MIGGNINAILQVKGVEKVNEIGEKELGWSDCLTMVGWLDFQSGEASFKNLNAKIQETTHLFICDFTAPKAVEGMIWNPSQCTLQTQDGETIGVNAENARLLIDGVVYDMTFMDDPMNLHQHFEFFLKMIGGVDNVS